jgi:acyl-CoA thioester hydrolase
LSEACAVLKPGGPMFEAKLRVIYGDTDQMGVVYYANYFRYFEYARAELFRARGGTYREFERQGFLLPVVEAHAHYRQSARYDDLLVIRTVVRDLRRTSLTFAYELFREGDDFALVTGHTVHVCLRKEDGKPVRLPPSLVDLLGAA